MKNDEKLAEIDKLLERLRGNWIFVEGKRDKSALQELGIREVYTISGNLRLSCQRLAERGYEGKVIVLTDLDRRGDELATLARDELEGQSVTADIKLREALARALGIRYFEDAKRAYDKIKDEKR